ncbi:MAG: hypothetical protein MZU95_04880 [Desulfomicrobium escambiense]|nr:hypothetical protein [Desulfomicrobium escambiense]
MDCVREPDAGRPGAGSGPAGARPDLEYVDGRVYLRPAAAAGRQRLIRTEETSDDQERLHRRARHRDAKVAGRDRRGHRGSGEVEIIGIGRGRVAGHPHAAPSSNQEAAVESIRKAVEAAELTAGDRDRQRLRVGSPGRTSRASTAAASWRWRASNREITRDDVRRAIDAARGRQPARPAGRSSTCMPQDFVVDDAGRHRGPGRDDRRPASRSTSTSSPAALTTTPEHRDLRRTGPASTSQESVLEPARREPRPS